MRLAIAAAIICGIGSWLAVSGMRRWAIQRAVLDVPGERSLHTQPTPRGGGLPIAALTLLALTASAFLDVWRPQLSLAVVAGAAAVIAAISWLDDLWTLSPAARFLVQIAAAVAVVAAGYRFETLAFPGQIVALGMVAPVLTVVWIVGLTNAFNFMDGIDGIAALQAVVGGLTWTVIGAAWSEPLLALGGLFVAATTLGFLAHNWPPARIFMGDVGSAFLGFFLAVLPLVAATKRPEAVWCAVLPLWPFIYDASQCFLVRLSEGEAVWRPHRRHLYQRLVKIGYSHRSVTMLYGGLALGGMGLALALTYGVLSTGASLATIALAALLLSISVRRLERRAT